MKVPEYWTDFEHWDADMQAAALRTLELQAEREKAAVPGPPNPPTCMFCDGRCFLRVSCEMARKRQQILRRLRPQDTIGARVRCPACSVEVDLVVAALPAGFFGWLTATDDWKKTKMPDGSLALVHDCDGVRELLARIEGA